MTDKPVFENIEALDKLSDRDLVDLFDVLEGASDAQLNTTAPFESSVHGAVKRASDMANEVRDAQREGRPIESVTPEWSPESPGGPDLKGEVVDNALDQAERIGEDVEGVKGFKSVLGKLSGGLPGEMMDRFNEAVDNSPFHSHQDTVPNVVDHVIAHGTNKELQTIQLEAGIALEDQFRVTAEMYDGPTHEQLNVMIGIADRMESPEMREGLFERMVEMQERHAVDKASHATPALGVLRDLVGRDGLDSVEKLDRLVEVSESLGIYNSHGGGLSYDDGGMPMRDMDILRARHYDQDWIAEHGEPTGQGTHMLSVPDAHRYYDSQVAAGDLHTDNRPGFHNIFGSNDFDQALTALSRETFFRHGNDKVVEIEPVADHAHGENAANALTGLMNAADLESLLREDIISYLENASALEAASRQSDMEMSFDDSLYSNTVNDEYQYGLD